MRPALLYVCCASTLALAQTSSPPQNPAPLYVQSSIVNAANPKAPALAPNTLATLYGKHLAWTTRAIRAEDIRDGVLPTALPGAGVRVLVGGITAPLLYVSPEQVNFLVPSSFLPGEVEVRLSLDSRYGSAVKVRLEEASPALFQYDPEFAIAARADSSVVTHADPAKPGEVIILYATGLGRLRPQPPSGQITQTAARIERISEFRVELDGQALSAEAVLYCGAAPGFPGLYQINLRLPADVRSNPEIRIGFGNGRSPEGVRIPVSP